MVEEHTRGVFPFTSGHLKYIIGAMLGWEVAWIFCIALSFCSGFCFSPFPSSLSRFAVASLPLIFLSLPPPILCSSDCVKSPATARKSFKKCQNIVKKVYIWWQLTGSWRECRSRRLLKGEGQETSSRAVDQRPLGSIGWGKLQFVVFLKGLWH